MSSTSRLTVFATHHARQRPPSSTLPVSEDRYRSVVDNSPFGIYRVTHDGRFITVNPALCAMVGYTAEELFASNALMLYSDPNDRAMWLEKIDQLPRGVAVDVAWKHKGGSPIAARIWVFAQRDEAGQLSFIDGYVEDVTPIRATEQALRQSEKLAALGQLVSGVAHELNNPLAAILLFTEDLLASERSVEEREALGIIAQQARRSRAIVRDLLSFVRSREVARVSVAVETLLIEIARALQPQVSELAVELHVDVPRENDVILIDRAGIEQILTNLVVNAAQATGPSGNIWLRTRRDGDEILFEVVDDGPGVSAEVLPRIFEPFFTTKPMGQGTGLGLSVSLGIAQQHGGTIAVADRDPRDGPGARFTLRLPRGATTRPVPQPATRAPGTGDRADQRRVLIIDDETTIRRALSRYYTRRGWIATEAENGARALEHLLDRREDFDLIVSDVKMPELSGIELHAALEAQRPEILDRVVFCTGEMQSAAVAAFFAKTGRRVLLKPFDLKTLAAVSDEIVALGGARS
jgi:PAS domain S-box-containing protein